MSYRKQTEEAFKAYLQDQVGVPVYAGTNDTIKAMPCVVVAFVGASQNPPNTGNMDVTLSVSVQSEIDEEGQPNALNVHDELLTAVEESLFWSELQAINVGANDFYIFGVADQSGIEREVEGTMLRESITLTFPAALGVTTD